LQCQRYIYLGGLVAIGLQVWQLTQLPFYPGSSGYASCFIGWAALNIALLLGGVYWLETLLARWLRLRRAVTEDGGAVPSLSAAGPGRLGSRRRLSLPWD